MTTTKGGNMDEKKHEPEIHAKHDLTHHQPVSKVDKKVVMAVIVLAFLLVFSIVQTIQLVGMKRKLQNEVSLGSTPLAGKKEASTKVADNIKNLPGMVGGC